MRPFGVVDLTAADLDYLLEKLPKLLHAGEVHPTTNFMNPRRHGVVADVDVPVIDQGEVGVAGVDVVTTPFSGHGGSM
ncbi:hypothetical protein ACFUCV_11935 [Specibacter sp. NPDC057265]|uniref:hypothetical protein n=1 Tax=Specibacter sp. NPDC057265 TaxID=3346075 RepID=UPI0036397F0E